jgi:hypothetical protein
MIVLNGAKRHLLEKRLDEKNPGGKRRPSIRGP